MRNQEEIWDRFVELRGWEHFDPDLDNEGGADSMTEQARAVLARIDHPRCLVGFISPIGKRLSCQLEAGHEEHHRTAGGLEFEIETGTDVWV